LWGERGATQYYTKQLCFIVEREREGEQTNNRTMTTSQQQQGENNDTAHNSASASHSSSSSILVDAIGDNNSNTTNDSNTNRANTTYYDYSMDLMSKRVVVCGAMGGIGGTVLALYRGYQTVPRTAALTAMSCALAATACFGCERITDCTVRQILFRSSSTYRDGSLSNPPPPLHLFLSWEHDGQVRLVTHTIGGMLGGAWLGGLYIQKPIRGALFFTPLMLMIGYGHNKLLSILSDDDNNNHPHVNDDDNKRLEEGDGGSSP
jgi:hypothetical protein